MHRKFPVVKVYYEKNDPGASGMAIYDSSVGISLQLGNFGYVDIMRPLQSTVFVTLSKNGVRLPGLKMLLLKTLWRI